MKFRQSLSFSKNGNIYFLSLLEGVEQQRGIHYLKKDGNRYLKPELLPELINSKYQDWTPFIAPDNSYLIFHPQGTRNKMIMKIYI